MLTFEGANKHIFSETNKYNRLILVYLFIKYHIALIMNLLKIKKRCDEIDISIRALSAKIEMSEQNLHKCIRDGRIEAGVLEKIAKVLCVPVSYFFDEVEPVQNAKDSEIIELQRKYITLLEKRLEEVEGRKTRQVG